MTIYFYLKKSEEQLKQPLYCRIQCGMLNGKPDRATFSTKVFSTPEQWDKSAQRIKGGATDVRRRNQDLLELEEKLKGIESCNENITASEIKEIFLSDGKKKAPEKLLLSTFIDEYIKDIETGKERIGTGRKIKTATLLSWKQTANKLQEFIQHNSDIDFSKKTFDNTNNPKARGLLAKYFLEYCDSFINYCADEGLKDNTIHLYVGKLKTILLYIQRKHFINLNNIQKDFRTSVDNFEVVAIPEETFFKVVANRKKIEAAFTNLGQVKALDYIIFGGMVALRVSDMLALRRSNFARKGNIYSMMVTTIKTETPVSIDLPEFLTEIIDKNLLVYQRPLPPISPSGLNLGMKSLTKKISLFDVEVDKYRMVAGEKKLIGTFKLSELISPHMLRRTAVSNMLAAGVPTNIIKAIGGWAPSSKTFEERYLAFNQSHANKEVKKYYEKIEEFIKGNVA